MKGSEKMKRLTVLVDIDDVLWELVEGWVAALNRSFGYDVRPEDITQWEIGEFFPNLTAEQVFSPMQDPGFWDTLRPVRDAQDCLRRLKTDGHKVVLVSASDYKTVAPKLDSLLRLYPFISHKEIVIAQDKSLVAGDLIVDDKPGNLIGTRCPFCILFDRPANRWFQERGEGVYRACGWREIYASVYALAWKERPEWMLWKERGDL